MMPPFKFSYLQPLLITIMIATLGDILNGDLAIASQGCFTKRDQLLICGWRCSSIKKTDIMLLQF